MWTFYQVNRMCCQPVESRIDQDQTYLASFMAALFVPVHISSMMKPAITDHTSYNTTNINFIVCNEYGLFSRSALNIKLLNPRTVYFF